MLLIYVMPVISAGKLKGTKAQNHTQSGEPLWRGTPSQTNYATPSGR